METNLVAFLTTLSTGGAAALVAALFSYLSEQFPAFGKQPPAAKLAEHVGLSGGLGLGAWYLLTYQPALLAQLQPGFAVIVLSVAPILINQAWHKLVNKA